MASKKARSEQSLLKGGANHISLCYRLNGVVFDLKAVYKAVYKAVHRTVHKAVYGIVFIGMEISPKFVRFVL